MNHDAVLKRQRHQQQQLHERRAALVSATARDPRVARVYVASNVSIQDTCEFYNTADAISRCRVPRSCQDCLQTPGCGITTYGECRNVTVDLRGCRKPRTCQECLLKPGCAITQAKCTDTYSWSQDFRNAKLDVNNRTDNYGSDRWYFPSSNTTYCSASDSTCAKCRRNYRDDSRDDWYSIVWYSGFCVGQDGCVCIEACEDKRWSTGVFDECNRSNSGNGNRPEPANPFSSFAIAVFSWIVVVFVYNVACNKTPVSPRRRGLGQTGGPRILRHMLDEAPSVIRMNLSGWRGDHERLRAREERVLRGEDPDATPLAPDTNCDSVDDATEDDSSRNASSTELNESNTELQSESRGDAVRRRSARNL